MTPKQMQKRRENLIFGSNKNDYIYLGGIEHFSGLSVSNLYQLLIENLIDPNGCQNFSPTVDVFYEFGRKWDHIYDILYIGYIVESKRDDHKVSIEGFQVDSLNRPYSSEFMTDLNKLFRQATEFDIKDKFIRVWYD